MSPYRVFVKEGNSEKRTILAAMLVINKEDNRRIIRIVEKIGYLQSVDQSVRQIAHKQTSTANSEFLDTYEIVYASDGTKYRVNRMLSNGIWYPMPDVEFKQSDCLAKAMHDYCNRNGYIILQVL